MQVDTNQQYKKGRKRITRWTFAFFLLAFLAIVLSVIFLSQFPIISWLAWILVIAAFFVSSIGRQVQFEDGISVSTEDRLSRALSPLNNRYWLGSYIPTIGTKTVPHMLVGPEGVLVIQPRNHQRETRCTNGKWSRKSGLMSRFMGMEPPIGDPGRDLKQAMELTSNKLAESGYENVPVSGAVVFTSGDTILILDNCPVTAMTIKQLSKWAANHKVSNTVIDEPTRRNLIEEFSALIPEKVPQQQAPEETQKDAHELQSNAKRKKRG